MHNKDTMNTSENFHSEQWNDRTVSLIGQAAVDRLARTHVLVVGCGGVGGYVIEMLVRSGVGALTIIDADTVGESNLNRQLIARCDSIGEPKVDLWLKRCRSINPECRVRPLREFVSPQSVGELLNYRFDFVADCIDTVAPKVALLSECVRKHVKVISSMGAGGRVDPAAVRYADLWETANDGLARAVRTSFKRMGYRPHIPVVCSSEAPRHSSLIMEHAMSNKRSGYGTLATIPSMFGIFMASYIIRKLIQSE